MVAIGPKAFDELLIGMHGVDSLSATLPVEENPAVLLALVDVWNHCHLGRGSVAVVPYAHRLRLFIPWLQQLSMESLGKRVCHDGTDPETATGAVIWGATGTDAQHAFFQLLHQGTEVVPVDLIGVARPATDDPRAKTASELLVTNLAAQARHGTLRSLNPHCLGVDGCYAARRNAGVCAKAPPPSRHKHLRNKPPRWRACSHRKGHSGKTK